MPVKGYYLCKWSLSTIIYLHSVWRYSTLESWHKVPAAHQLMYRPGSQRTWLVLSFHFILISPSVCEAFILITLSSSIQSFDPGSTFLHYSKGSELNTVFCLMSQKWSLHRIYTLKEGFKLKLNPTFWTDTEVWKYFRRVLICWSINSVQFIE